MSWLIASLRRLRQGRLAFAGLALLVFVTALAAGGLPRIFAQVSTDSIQAAVAGLPAADRDLELDQTDTGGTASGSAADYIRLQDVLSKATSLRKTFPAPLPSVVGPSTAIVETPSFQALQGTALAAEIRLRIMEDVDGHIRLVAGRSPTGALGMAPDILRGSSSTDSGPPSPEQATVPQLEAEISASAAAKLGLTVGSSIFLAAQSSLDPLASGPPLSVKVVGIFELRDPSDPYWIDDAKVSGWTLREFSSNVTFVQSTLLLSPDAYPHLVSDRRQSVPITAPAEPRRISWRFPIEPQKLTPDAFPAAVSALRRLQAIYPPDSLDQDGVVLTTRLLGRLVALQPPWDAAAAVLLVAGLGAGAVAIATLGLLIALTSEERRRAVILQRERGASGAQALWAVLVEALLLAVPPAALATRLLFRLFPDGDGRTAVVGPAAVALLTVGLEVAVVLMMVLGPPRLPGREANLTRPVSPRRLVFEGLVVLLAIVGAIILRSHGLQPADGAAVSGVAGVVEPTSVVSAGSPDPFLAAIPVLVGLAAALVALRLVPFPLAGLSRLAALWPDLGPVLAVRRAARGSGASRVLLIILATTTVGAFASATIVDLSQTSDLQAWQDVGAAYRIEPAADPLAGIPPLPDAFDPSHLPGVTASATAFVGPVAFSSGGAQQLLVALDPAAYARVVAGTPAAIDWPAAMLAVPTRSGAGSSASPLPAIIASPSGSPFSIAKGDTFLLVVGSRTVTVRAVEVLPRFPGVPADRPFVVLSRPQLAAAAPGSLRPPTTAFLRAPPEARPDLVSALKAAAPQTALVTEAAEASALAGQPVVDVLSAGVVALAALALLYAALAVVAAFILAASQRAAETAHLATLGLTYGQARRMLLAEYGPPVAMAVLAGAGLGLGLFVFLEPGLGFTAIIGVVRTAPPGLDLAQVGLLVLLIGAILLLGVALGAPAQRRAAGAAVRRGLT